VASENSYDTVRTPDNGALAMDAIFSKEELTIPKATVLGVAKEITEAFLNKINAENQPKSDVDNDRQGNKRNELLYRKLVLGKLDHLSEE
jgi:hypothetical protein